MIKLSNEELARILTTVWGAGDAGAVLPTIFWQFKQTDRSGEPPSGGEAEASWNEDGLSLWVREWFNTPRGRSSQTLLTLNINRDGLVLNFEYANPDVDRRNVADVRSAVNRFLEMVGGWTQRTTAAA